MAQDFRTWRARLDEVHDGDSLRLTMDTGFDNTTRKWLRLRAVFAPELKQRGGPSTRDFVQKWLWQHGKGLDSPWPLEVDTYRTSGGNDVKTLDRYLAEVRCAHDGSSLNAALGTFLAEHPDWPQGVGA